MHLLAALLAAAAVLGTPAAPRAQEGPAREAAWAAAHDLKKKADYERAAAGFAAYARDFPGTPRGIEALVEEGVCLFSLGRAQQRLQQNTQASLSAFGRADARFRAVVDQHADSAVAGRAQYMRGTVALFSGDLVGAEREYGSGLERFAADAKYRPKSLERRAAVRRHKLDAAGARSDLQRYVREFPAGEDVESARRYLAMMELFEKPAPALAAGEWVQGGPAPLASLRGDVVVLYFFATWCENCEKARPFLQDLEQRFEAHGVRFIGVVDHSQGQTPDAVRAFLAAKGLRFPVFMDQGRTAAAFRGQKIPDVVILDREGRVRWHDNPANLQDATLELLLVEDPATVGGVK
ncbi:MAG: redoxin domain-containing protein [Planctomycetes bacterium]|nr:redoxin domain-containing protein [Planctomycetota bacterium]